MAFWVASKLALRKLGQGRGVSSLHLARWEKPFRHTSPSSHPQPRLQRTHCVNRPLGCGPQGGPSRRGRQRLWGVGVGAAGLSFCTPGLRFALPLVAAPCLQTVIPHSLEHRAEESIEGIGTASDDHHGWWDLENNPNFGVTRNLTPPHPRIIYPPTSRPPLPQPPDSSRFTASLVIWFCFCAAFFFRHQNWTCAEVTQLEKQGFRLRTMVSCTFPTAAPKGHHLVYCGPSSLNLTNLYSNFREPLAPIKTVCGVGVFSGLSS